MAFGNKGAIWLQKDDQTRNPYFGSTMLKCADRVEKVVHDEPAMKSGHETHPDHVNP